MNDAGRLMVVETPFDQISKSAGVDFNHLKDKYKSLQTKIDAEYSSNNVAARETKISESTVSLPVSNNDMQRLDNYRICKTCLGKGTVKRIYNHMVLERDCEECDGNSIIYSVVNV
jgi:DnaJ-class molecular chaperone